MSAIWQIFYLFSNVDCYISESQRDNKPSQDIVVIANQPSTPIQHPSPRKVSHGTPVYECVYTSASSAHSFYTHVAKHNAHAHFTFLDVARYAIDIATSISARDRDRVQVHATDGSSQ